MTGLEPKTSHLRASVYDGKYVYMCIVLDAETSKTYLTRYDLDVVAKTLTRDKTLKTQLVNIQYGLGVYSDKLYYNDPTATTEATINPADGSITDTGRTIDFRSKGASNILGFREMGDEVIISSFEGLHITVANRASIVHKLGSHYDIGLEIYKHGTDIKVIGHDLADITKNKDYAEQDLGDGLTDDGHPKLIIKH